MPLTFLSLAFTDFDLLVLTTLNGSESDLLCKWKCRQHYFLSPGLCRKPIKNVEDESLEGLCYIFPWLVMQCLHSDTGSGDGQYVTPLIPDSCLRLQQDKAVVEEGLCSPYWGDKKTVATSFDPWKMFWRPFAGVFVDITEFHLAMGNHFHSYPFFLFLCPFPTVSLGSDYRNGALCAMRAFWCSESSNRRKRTKECRVQSDSPALFIQERWQFPCFQWGNVLCFLSFLHSVLFHWFKHRVALSCVF